MQPSTIEPKWPGAKERIQTDKLQELRRYYISQLTAAVPHWREHQSRLLQVPPDLSALEALHSEVHKLHGSAGFYGLHDISEAARDLDRILQSADASLPEAQAALAWLVDQLLALAQKQA